MSETKLCPQCAETIQSAAVMCRFCKHRFDAQAVISAAPPKKGLSVIVILILIGGASIPVISIIAAIAIPGLLASQRAANERSAMVSLKQLASAEMEFRVGDLDGNGTQDFWTRDVQGLSTMSVQGRPLMLIDASVARADTSSGVKMAPTPKNGYVFLAMQMDAEGKPYDLGKGRNPLHFAFCAYPANPKSGRKTFIINEDNQIWMGVFGGQPIYGWPPNPSAAGFRRLD